MTYTLARTLDEACTVLANGGQVIAGGTDYFPARKQGSPTPQLIDVSRVAEMQSITHGTQGWQIGGAVTWSDVIAHQLPPAFDGLKAAAREVGSVQIQNAGTVAGNLCNASPAADGVPPLLTLDARVVLCSSRGKRELTLSEFIQGPRKTALAPDEVLSAIIIPPLPSGLVGRFEKLGSRRYLVISITMVSAALVLDDAGRIEDARIAVGACSAVAQRQSALEAFLIGKEAARVTVTPDQLERLHPLDDVRADARYRMTAAAEQCTRAVRALGAA